MNSIKTLALAAVATIALQGTALAEGTKIAVVNIQSIMKDSTAAKSIRTQLEAKQKAYQAEIAKKEEAMQKEEQELSGQRATLSKEAFEQKVNAFRTKATAMQKDVQDKKATLDGAFEKALNDVQKAVNDIITEQAKEKGFNIAIPSSQLLYAEPGMDITAEVLTKLNAKLPNVTVNFSK
jgi:Skp family chaperone for outer membrane proteins